MTEQGGCQDKLCLGCSSVLPEPFIDLGQMPLANAFIRPEDAARPEPTFPLAIAYCPVCHLVQLTEQVPPKQLFTEYIYFSSYSESWLSHARRMADALIQRLHLNSESRVLEIGSNDGYLLQYFERLGIPDLGVEPATNIAREAECRGIPTLHRFFGSGLVEEILSSFGKADLVIGNNVLAHVAPINEFLKAVKSCLKPTGVAVFEFPHVKEMLDRIEFDTIYHEHVFYFSLSAIKIVVERTELEVFDVARQPVHGGSLRVFLQGKGMRPVTAAVQGMLADEARVGLTGPDRYVLFNKDVARSKERLLSLLEGLKAAGKRLAGYGAPAKGTILLNYCSIGTDFLMFTVDRNPHKQGRLTPGMHLPIRPAEDLLVAMPDYTVILPWNIADEVLEQQAEYRRRGGRFIIPIPDAKLV